VVLSTRLRDIGSAGAKGVKVDPKRISAGSAIWRTVDRAISPQERCQIRIHHIINRKSKRLPVDSIKASDNYAAIVVLAYEKPPYYLAPIHWN
jgi:hypothetical protein